MPDYSKSEYEERRAAAVARRDALNAQKFAQERAIHGTFAENLAAKRALEGDFRQRASLQRELQGSFPERAAHDINLHGTFQGKEAGQDRRLRTQGRQAMRQLAYQHGPGSLEERKFNQLGEWQKGQLELEGRRVGLMTDENDIKGRTAAYAAMASAQKNAADLFPEDSAAAQKFYQKEIKRIGAMFPGVMPSVEDALAPGAASPAAVGTGAQPFNLQERYGRSMASRITDPLVRYGTTTPSAAASAPVAGPTVSPFARRPTPVSAPPLNISRDPGLNQFLQSGGVQGRRPQATDPALNITKKPGLDEFLRSWMRAGTQ